MFDDSNITEDINTIYMRNEILTQYPKVLALYSLHMGVACPT